ncbi:hypothetical protein NC651_021107 [Populus alba x Populus x berolinensis]|nr:hypothetical protein NC651_021107 [Populus alba x Populus x berolinensis]
MYFYIRYIAMVDLAYLSTEGKQQFGNSMVHLPSSFFVLGLIRAPLLWRPSTTMALLTNTSANIYSVTNHVSWSNSTFMGGKFTALYLIDSCQFLQLPAKSPSGDKFRTRTYARRKSVRKWTRDERSQNGIALESTEKGLEEERVVLSDKSSLEDNSVEPVQSTLNNIASRSDVLQACTVTSGLIAALGILIRQARLYFTFLHTCSGTSG